MGVKADGNLVIHIFPVGMVAHFLGFKSNGSHKRKRIYKIPECKFFKQEIVFKLPIMMKELLLSA